MDYGPDDQIDREAPEAPYEQLAAILRARISRGDWAPRRAIPSEAALCELYKLSRPTVRRSIAALVAEGRLFVVHPRGTFVAERVDQAEPRDS
ncbi:GntR family transcriptional regulator [Kitasatospora purpeofusca]|uniref:GntR family transcriptional regulator n=1 Tax=Kitasatospora purpeofusca TaxID=67352 RepID=UPI002250E39A|nr:GntR family transcriptional regulator [Kitasatospora purpeofusca]MCX4687200.1 GntR family transcriptional regulator [Kitasatospora purpeofusca]